MRFLEYIRLLEGEESPERFRNWGVERNPIVGSTGGHYTEPPRGIPLEEYQFAIDWLKENDHIKGVTVKFLEIVRRWYYSIEEDINDTISRNKDQINNEIQLFLINLTQQFYNSCYNLMYYLRKNLVKSKNGASDSELENLLMTHAMRNINTHEQLLQQTREEIQRHIHEEEGDYGIPFTLQELPKVLSSLFTRVYNQLEKLRDAWKEVIPILAQAAR